MSSTTQPRLRKRLAAQLAVAIAATALGFTAPVFEPSPAPAAAAPFTCAADFFWVQDGRLFRGSPLNSPFGVPVGPGDPTRSYNALGYNQEDGLLYAIGAAGGDIDQQLVSIDDTGIVTPLGTVSGLPGATWNAGAFDDAGNLWIAPSTGHALYRIDVSARTVTQTVVPAGATGTYSPDLVWHDGDIVRVVVGNPSRVRIIDTTTGAWVDSTGGTISSSAALGAPAMWISEDDRLFTATRFGVIGEIVDWQTPEPSYLERTESGVGTMNGDGASCAGAPAPFGITATDDDRTTTPLRASSGGTVGSIFANDTVDLAVPNASTVTVRVVDYGGLAGVTIAGDGTVTVPAGMTPGTYRVTYEICSVELPDECAEAVITILLVADDAVIPAGQEPAPTLPATGSTGAGALAAGSSLLLILGGLTAAFARRRTAI